MAASNQSPVLFDTDVLIDFLRRRVAAREFIVEARVNRPAIYYASITVAELYAGMRAGEEPEVTALLGTMTSIPLTDRVAQDAGDYLHQFRAQGVTLSMPDTIIAASAKSVSAELATRNIKHYPMSDIVVIKPYTDVKPLKA